MALKIIQLEAKDLAGQYLGFSIFNASALSSKCDMRTEGGMKDISSVELLWLDTLKECRFCFIPCCYINRIG
jgi:hypothetical protein